MNACPPLQFAAFRVLFGSYLVWLFASVVPYAAELFSSEGMPSRTPAYPFPSVFALADGPVAATSIVALLLILSLLVTLGIARRWAALLIWYGMACLLHRTRAIYDVGLPYVGWLLLACALVPEGEPHRLLGRAKKQPWSMPPAIYYGAWIVLASGYSVSGYSKLQSEPWTSGVLFAELLEFPAARASWLTHSLLSLPGFVGTTLTWVVILAELLFLPLCLFAWTRKLSWVLLAGTHAMLILIVDGAQISVALLLFHLFTLDARWYQGHRPDPALRMAAPGGHSTGP